MSLHPVFYDEKRKRWPRVRQAIFGVAFICTLLFGIFLISILANPILRELHLPSAKLLPRKVIIPPPAKIALQDQDKSLKELKREINREKTMMHPVERIHQDKPQLSFGFFVNWDDSSFTSLKQNIGQFDVLIPEWLHLTSATGTVALDNPDLQKTVVEYVKSRSSHLEFMPLINNFNGTSWETEKLGAMLHSDQARTSVEKILFDYVSANNFQGISIDFESINDADQPYFLKFIRELSTNFHGAGLKVSVNAPADDDVWQYSPIAALADYEILMMYDDYSPSDNAGPIASYTWFSQLIDKRQKQIPENKMVVALGSYAYDWQAGTAAKELTFEDAVLTASDSEGVIGLDPKTLNPTFDYYDDNDALHHVWMLDAITAFNELALLQHYNVRGTALWRLGSEDPSLWKIWQTNDFSSTTAASLSEVKYGYDLDYEGTGEILKVTTQPKLGERNIGFDAGLGLITSQKYVTFPVPYTLTRYGFNDRTIALSFDDGPDPYYTPQVLDILKKYQVPATFFVIGENVEYYPGLLSREYAEGNEIGNHTFTHPNISTVSPLQLRLEMAATERLFESILGHQSLLFRPPYAIDSEPETPDQMQPVTAINDLGYLTVGMQIDPGDWQQPGVQTIVDRVVSDAEDGTGNVVLLHDSGGNRDETIAALPLIITRLQSMGYRFVTVSGLLHKTRDEVMPPLTAAGRLTRTSNRISFFAALVLITFFRYAFLAGIVLGVFKLFFFGIMAVIEWRNERKLVFDRGYMRSVAVIVAAYNEEKVIEKTIRSLLASSYAGSLEIVVVDDGSKDNTVGVVEMLSKESPRILLVRQENAGKSAALNAGIRHTAAEIVITLDADTVFVPDTIAKLVRHFSDKKIGAVAGNAKVGNRMNIMTRWQALEYITSQNLDRRAFSQLNCITVVPGAIGAWRRLLVLQSGGFNNSTLAEDADLTIAIRRQGYSTVYEDGAIAYTEAPQTVRDFLTQRYRWMFGTLQVAWKHKDALFRKRYGTLGFVALPNIIIFQVVFPLISPIMDLLMLASLLNAAIARLAHPAQFTPDVLLANLFFYALFLATDFLSGLLAFFLEPQEDKRLLVNLFPQRFFYRQLLYYVAIKSFFASVKGIVVGWNKLERKDTVSIAPK